MSYADRW